MIALAGQPDAILAWMDCLADGTRLRLLRLLDRNELGVIELCDCLQLPQSTVSNHLKVLADQNWVHRRRQGTTQLYRMILDELEPSARRLWLLAREQTEGWATCKQDQLRLARRLKAKGDEGHAFFAGAAGQWDKLRAELYGSIFTEAAIAALLPADYIIADLGCGTGPVAARIAPHVKQVIGVDSSAAMLKAARRRLGDAGNVDLRRGDLQAVPIDDATCDAALMVLALTYVADPFAAIREARRIVKSRGRVVVIDLLPHDRDDFRRQMGQQALGFEQEQMTDWMEAAGFTQVVCTPLPPEANVKGPALFLATAERLPDRET